MSKSMINKAITAVLALGLTGTCAAASPSKTEQTNPDPYANTPSGMERCFGVAQKGMNDCGTASHNCSGEAKLARDPKEWVLVPSGLCKRIAGGNTTPEKVS